MVAGLSMPDQFLLPLILVAGIRRLHEICPGIRTRALLMLVTSRTRSRSHICRDMLLPCLVVAVTYGQSRVLLRFECFLALL